MECPNCGSRNIRAGTPSMTQYSIGGVQSVGPTEDKAVFQSCGFSWDFKKPVKPGKKAVILAVAGCMWAVLITIIFFSGALNGGKEENTDDGSIWATAYTSLDDFEYYIGDDGIHLKDCESGSRKIWIAGTYQYEGKTMPVASIEGGMFFSRCDSIIISEGISKIDNAAFNSCGVKNVYLPKTLVDFSGWSYFHDGEKLYYGGSKEQWNGIFKGNREDIDFVEIVFNADLRELMKIG